jgi:hypothetical protein
MPLASETWPRIAVSAAVSIAPGAMQLARTPCLPYVLAIPFVNVATALFIDA